MDVQPCARVVAVDGCSGEHVTPLTLGRKQHLLDDGGHTELRQYGRGGSREGGQVARGQGQGTWATQPWNLVLEALAQCCDALGLGRQCCM